MTPQQEKYIQQAAVVAGAAGAPGILVPGLDTAAIASIWTKLLVDLARTSGHEVDSAFATKTMTALLSGVGLYLGGSKLLTRALMFVPAAGLGSAGAMNYALNYVYT